MTSSPWVPLVEDESVPARPSAGLWTPVLDYVPTGTLIKIEAAGTWFYADEPEAQCGPDGNPRSFIEQASLLNTGAPVGALVGKVGGSTADRDGGHAFIVGSYCVVRIPDGQDGPLMLAINDLPAARDGNRGSLDVTVYEAKTASVTESLLNERRARMKDVLYDPKDKLEARLEFDSPQTVNYWLWCRTDGGSWKRLASGTDEEEVQNTGHTHMIDPLSVHSDLRVRLIFSGNPRTSYKASFQLRQGRHTILDEPFSGRTNTKGAKVEQEDYKLVEDS
jgi:hypothetical protein